MASKADCKNLKFNMIYIVAERRTRATRKERQEEKSVKTVNE
jgi:hypothetical protein